MSILKLSSSSDWETASVLSDYPYRRSGHSLTSYLGMLYLFGGCDLDTVCYNDLQVYNYRDSKWTEVQTTGSAPGVREGHIAVLIGYYLYIYGGTSLTEVLGDVFKLNLNLLEWEEVTLGGSAVARAYHAGVLHDHGLIFIFGGYTDAGLSSEILFLDTVNKHWGHPLSIGSSPSARKQHSLSRISTKVWLFGGETTSGITNDLWYYDLYKRHWYQITSTSAPSPRHGHAIITHGSKFYLLSGCNSIAHTCYSDLYTYSPGSNQWTLLNTGQLPSREAHSIDFVGGILFAFGGRYLMEECYSDFWELETDEPCPDDCSSHGVCTEIGCDCNAGWTGASCADKTVCRMNCNGHGACEDFNCVCYPGYYGSYCQGQVGCPSNCTSGTQGVCLDSSECSCFNGYTGKDCSLLEDWMLCEVLCINGVCEDLECICSSGWVGNYCDIEAPVIYSASSSVDDMEITTTEAVASPDDDDSLSVTSSSDFTLPIEPSADVEMSDESFENITTVQDISAGVLQEEGSLHLLVPEMFGFTDPADPTVYYAENLRRDPEKEEKEEWIEELEEKQDDRMDDIESCEGSCSYHGTCFSAVCYCEAGYTGDLCEVPEEDIGKGLKLSDGMISMICALIVGAGVGLYFLNKILVRIKMTEEKKVEEEKDDD